MFFWPQWGTNRTGRNFLSVVKTGGRIRAFLIKCFAISKKIFIFAPSNISDMEKTENTLLLEKRVSILEEQVQKLQMQVAALTTNEEEEAPQAAELQEEAQASDIIIQEEVVPQAAELQEEVESSDFILQEEKEPQVAVRQEEEEPAAVPEIPVIQPTTKSEVSWEAKIGKKLIPVAGSVLILVALVLFGSLIRPHLTDEMKALIMATISLAITGVGLWKMNPENRFHHFFSALAGCGVSACYISALVSHFALDVLPEMGLMLCVSLWIVCMIILSRFKSKMFTYICYVGILVAAVLTIVRWHENPIGLITYILSIGALFAANFSKDYRRVLWFFIQFPIVMLAMSLGYHRYDTSQFIIFGATLIVLFCQTAYYERRTSDVFGFIITTLFSIVPLGATMLVIDGWSREIRSCAFAGAMIALCVYYYRTFAGSPKKDGRMVFWLPYTVSALILPLLYYGSTYRIWSGNYLMPALVMIVLGSLMRNRIFQLTAFAFSGLMTLDFYPDICRVVLDSGLGFNCGCWIFAALLVVLFMWAKRNEDSLIQILVQLGGFWFILQLCCCHWVDSNLTYILMVGYGISLNFRPFKLDGNKVYDRIIVIPFVVLALMGIYIRRQIFGLDDDTSLVAIPDRFGIPLCSAVTALIVWGISYWKNSPAARVFSYIILLLLFFTMDSDYCLPLALVCYALVLAAMVYGCVHRYSQNAKLHVASLGVSMFVLPNVYDMIGYRECWILCAIYSLVLFCSRFCMNPTTGEEERASRVFCVIYNGILVAIGTLLLRYSEGPICIGHDIAGTEMVTTVLLVLLSMALAGVDIRYLYRTSDRNERIVSIYQGLKYTLLFWVILCRFSSTSYVNSIVGIILAVIFVSAGFRFQFKGLRLYGLCLSMLCVIKLIFFDIVLDNAIYRAGSFLIAGLLLFLISFIYFRLEKKSGGVE